MKLNELQEALSKLKCFSPADIKRYSGLSETAAQKIIYRYTKKGIFTKIRNGLYMFKRSKMPPLWFLANKIYAPSYVSFETILSYYGMIPESVYAITSATSKITRNIETMGYIFIYRKIKRNAFAGYKPIKIEDETVLIAEPEKALVDYLYFVYLKKIEINDRLKTKNVKTKDIVKYLKTFKNASFSRWVKNVIRKYY